MVLAAQPLETDGAVSETVLMHEIRYSKIFFRMNQLPSGNHTPQISAIVTFHAEGLVAHHTLLGLERLRRHADHQGIPVEFVAVLDAADAETVRVVTSSPVLRFCDQIIKTDNKDLGSSRNEGIHEARGLYIAIFDGDDYYSENWLTEAMKVVGAASGEIVVHPEFQISFGSDHCIARSIDMDEQPDYPMANCLSVHPWTACSFARRELYLKHPYHRTDLRQTGFGFEDWHWNLEIIAHDIRHILVPATAHFYRRKSSSMLTEMIAQHATIRTSRFFDHPSAWINKTEEEKLHQSNKRTTKRFLSKLARSIKKRVIKPKKKLEKRVSLPQWAIDELRNIATIEPDLFPTDGFLNKFKSYTPPLETLPGEVYAACHACIGDYYPDIIIVVPWLVRGGADLGVLHHVHAALEAGKKILVIATLDAESPWKERLPEQVRFIELGKSGRNLSEQQRLTVLARLVLQSSARVLHIINSQLGWEMIKKYGKCLLAAEKTMFASVYCDDYDQNNVRWSYPRFYLTDCWHYLEALFCDSLFYPDELKRQFGISTKKVHTLYFPTDIAHPQQYRSASTQRVLWAGRLTSQKRPDLLIGVAKALPDVLFDVYGYCYNHHDKHYEQALAQLPNVQLRGTYDSFDDLTNSSDYALFFYTSAWDGLPNVLLEAVAHGLPVVASAVCGTPEFINENTGYPVSDATNPTAYASRIKEALDNEEERRRRWENAINLLQSRHSSTLFLQSLNAIDGYFRS